RPLRLRTVADLRRWRRGAARGQAAQRQGALDRGPAARTAPPGAAPALALAQGAAGAASGRRVRLRTALRLARGRWTLVRDRLRQQRASQGARRAAGHARATPLRADRPRRADVLELPLPRPPLAARAARAGQDRGL